MFANAKLLHKLLAMVFLPMVLQLGIALFLSYLTIQTENIAANENRLRLAYQDLNDLYTRITSAAQIAATIALREDQSLDAGKFHADVMEPIEQDLARLRDSLKNVNDASAPLNDLTDNVETSLRVIDDSLSEIQNHNQMLALSNLKHLRSTAPTIKADLKTLQDKVVYIAAAQYQEQKWIRQIMTYTLIGVTVIDTILVIVLTRYVQSITSRLQIVMENAGRFVRKQPLLPPVPGKDEIAHLDHNFRDMTTALTQLEQFKQEFTSMISHDLRSPLASIQIFLNMLSKGMFGELPAVVTKKATAADYNATRLIGLINDLLDFEKMDSGQLKLTCNDIDLNAVIERSVESLASYAEQSNITMHVNATATAFVNADGERLAQVVINLLSNAIKFSPSGGKISVSLESTPGTITVRVGDEGRGIPEALQASIFERFKQVAPTDAIERKGTGLGLAICRAIVERHGGSIGVESQVGKGSTFWFEIPSIPQPSSIAVKSI